MVSIIAVLFIIDLLTLHANRVCLGIAFPAFKSCFLFAGGDRLVATHELGHVLGLRHAFKDENEPDILDDIRKVPYKSSKNYMDYTYSRNIFFKHQYWRIKR